MAPLPFGGINLEALTGLMEQLRRHGQVDLGVPDVNMPQVDGQMLEQSLYVGALLVSGRQAVNGE
jgi:hypothetical protein